MPYPFYIFDLDPNKEIDDEEVGRRYDTLIRRFPPDRAPEQFRVVRAAYEQLKDPRTRLRTRLFHFDVTDHDLAEDLPRWVQACGRRRLSTQQLATLLRGRK